MGWSRGIDLLVGEILEVDEKIWKGLRHNKFILICSKDIFI
jgi:hypothetical protein